jgi:hypothetical protein
MDGNIAAAGVLFFDMKNVFMRVYTRSHLMYASRVDLFCFYDSLCSVSGAIGFRYAPALDDRRPRRICSSYGHGQFIANIQCPKTCFRAETKGLGFSFCDLSDCGRSRNEAAFNWDVDGFAAEAPGMHTIDATWRQMCQSVLFRQLEGNVTKAVSPAPLTSRW